MNKFLNGIFTGLFAVVLFILIYFGLTELNSKTTTFLVTFKNFRPTTFHIQYQSNVDHQPKSLSYPIGAQQIPLPFQFEMKDFDETQYLRIYFGNSPKTIFIENILFFTFSFSKINYFGYWTPSNASNKMMNKCQNCTLVDSTTQYIQIETVDSTSYMEINLDPFRESFHYFKANHHEKIKIYFGALILSIFIGLSLKYSSPGSRMDFTFLNPKTLSPLVLLFAFILLSCFLNSIFHFVPDLSSKDNRKLEAVPNLGSYYQLPEKLDNYCKDHFAFRNYFLFLNSMMRLKVFHESSVPDKVIVGQNGFLFYNIDDMKDYRRLSKIDTTRDAVVLNKFINNFKWLEKRHCKFYILLPPGKEQIYSEYVPSQYTSREGYGYNLLKYYSELFLESGLLNVINPTDSLLSGRKVQDVYFNTDTHWNFWGGFKAYEAIISEMKKSFPDMNAIREEDLELKESLSSYGDLSIMLGINEMNKRKDVRVLFKDSLNYFNYNYPATIETIFRRNATIGNKRCKLIYFGDSFAYSLMPFLNKHFDESIYLRHYNLIPSLIESEKPDVVIFEPVEWSLFNALNAPNPSCIN